MLIQLAECPKYSKNCWAQTKSLVTCDDGFGSLLLAMMQVATLGSSKNGAIEKLVDYPQIDEHYFLVRNSDVLICANTILPLLSIQGYSFRIKWFVVNLSFVSKLVGAMRGYLREATRRNWQNFASFEIFSISLVSVSYCSLSPVVPRRWDANFQRPHCLIVSDRWFISGSG